MNIDKQNYQKGSLGVWLESDPMLCESGFCACSKKKECCKSYKKKGKHCKGCPKK